MSQFSDKDIREIAQQLDCGFRCFYHRETGELLFIPDELKHIGMDMDAWSDEQEKLENDFNSYEEIEQLQSGDSFQIIADFTEQLSGNERLQNQLIKALSNKHPFRNFKFVIDNSGTYRQQWFAFKDARLIDWVKQRLNTDTLNFGDHGGI
jgi:hypothetical protein